jgi:adenylate cyclase
MAHYALGRLHILAGETNQAISEMETAISLNPNFAPGHYGLAYAYYYSAGQPEQALPHFDNALRLSPRDPMRWGTLINIGSSLRILGRYEEAVSHCRQACQFPNANFLSHMHLAACLAEAGEDGEARTAIARAIEHQPLLSIAYLRDIFVNLHEAVSTSLFGSLRKAGLPEE